jgi:hypothetical protein
MMRDAVRYFDQSQGGKTGESPLRALTVEPTPELMKITNAPWVARPFVLLSVELTRRERWGYTPCDLALSRTKTRCNVTYHNFSVPCQVPNSTSISISKSSDVRVPYPPI